MFACCCLLSLLIIADPRLVFIPAADHDAGTRRPIFFSPENYPRYVGTERGIPAYYPTPGQQPMEPIGYIPQVAHTFQYMEDTYATINEHQVATLRVYFPIKASFPCICKLIAPRLALEKARALVWTGSRAEGGRRCRVPTRRRRRDARC
jgi:hypothetical protein